MDLLVLAKEICQGKRLNRNEDLSYFKKSPLEELCQGADYIRKEVCGNHVDLCSIINAKSGKCSENCKFCAQSLFNHTNCKSYSFLEEQTIISAAKENAAEGVHRFSLVTAGRALKGKEFEKAIDVYKKIHSSVNIHLCASMGFLSKEELERLKEAGVTSYHHNIETSRRNFPNICTSHSYQMKMQTLKLVKEVGLKICSGGIIGMGETFEDRIDMALDLSEIGADSIPLNTLMPIKGTPFEKLKSLCEEEILRTIAMFRYINPKAYIRLGAGRSLMKDSGKKAFMSGANGSITGNMLTTSGTTIKSDREMLLNMGRNL